ncbi:MAG: hypothetical protein RXR31_07280 [Thermoproteota archaeon]|jgi:hypothetical protein
MILKRPIETTIAMIGSYVNIIWIGIVVLAVVLGSFEYGMDLIVSGISTLIYSALSALLLKKSSEKNFNIKSLSTFVSLILINAIAYSIFYFKISLFTLIYFFILTGPGTYLVIVSILIKTL